MFDFQKCVTAFGFLRFLSSPLRVATDRSIQVCRTTGVEGTYQTLTVIPSKVVASNSSIVFAIVSLREIIAEFLFLYNL